MREHKAKTMVDRSPTAHRSGPVQDDGLFWIRAGFFTPERLRYLADAPNEPTLLACKCILVDCLRGLAPPPPADAHWDQQAGWAWYGSYVKQVLMAPGGFPLKDALMQLVRGPVTSTSDEGLVSEAEWLPKLAAEIDYCWIAERVQQDLERHGHRRGLRALEVALAMPYEHIEARLEGFVGPFEEMFCRVSNRRGRRRFPLVELD